jgi:imidazolonepropionase-like amidohydrolase
MIRTAVLAFLLLLAVIPAARAETGAPETIAYVNGNWWDGAVFEPGDRYVERGVFVAAPSGAPARTVDLDGAYVVPPYADAHNHMPGTAQSVSDRATSAGVFYLMNPTILASSAPAVRKALEGPGKIDAVLSMGAITAPDGHPVRIYQDFIGPRVYPNIKPADFLGDAYHFVTKPSDIGPVLDRLQKQGAQFIKIMILYSEEFAKRRDDPKYRGLKGLDPALVPPIVREAHRRGLRVAAHIETANDFRVIVAAGVDEAAHMPGYAAEGPDMSRYRITDDDARAAARSGMIMTPTASLALAYNDKDPVQLARVQQMQKSNLQKLKRAGVPLLIGTDQQPDAAPSEAAYLIKLGVFTPTEALDALSRTTPLWIFPGRKIGRLATGYEASFLVLGGDPTADFHAATDIRMRVKQGFDVKLPAPEHP